MRIGEICFVNKNYILDGELAFAKNEEVRVEDIDADPLSPGRKYVVQSAALGKRFRLSGGDLVRKYCPECGTQLEQLSDKCTECRWAVPGKEHLARHKQRPIPPGGYGGGIGPLG